MSARKYLVPLLLSALTASVQASPLTGYQEAALQKILASMPEEQRAVARPMLEKSLAGLSKEHVSMMLAGMANDAAQQPEDAGTQAQGGEWGAVEADFDKAFTAAQAYIARVSDLRDTAGPTDLCRTELNLVPIGRSKVAGIGEVAAEQDRLMLRLMLEQRARYGSVEAFARQVGQPVSSPMVQSVKYYFAAPMSEDEVRSKLQSIQAEAAKLAAAHEKERIRIANGKYTDRGSAIFSRTEQAALQALEARTAQASKQLCEPGLGYFQRGLVGFIAPLVPKVKPFVQ